MKLDDKIVKKLKALIELQDGGFITPEKIVYEKVVYFRKPDGSYESKNTGKQLSDVDG